ncbi:ATP-binding protein [Mangrovicoccus ximenensis]|uniref:ATP-binding protein n=1 Tax=Mangrovicoccus ximenensis TaxID=1911570 RepID=UPI002ED1474F
MPEPAQASRQAAARPASWSRRADGRAQSARDRRCVDGPDRRSSRRDPDIGQYAVGSTGTGKSHLATALGVAAVKAGRTVCRATLAELTEALSRAERPDRLPEKIRFHTRTSLLIAGKIGYLPITRGGAYVPGASAAAPRPRPASNLPAGQRPLRKGSVRHGARTMAPS